MKLILTALAVVAALCFPAMADTATMSPEMIAQVTSPTPMTSPGLSFNPVTTTPIPPAVIGGPVGVPAVVVAPAPASGGLLDIGQAFSASVAPFVNAGIQAILAAGLGWLSWWLRTRFNITVNQAQQQTVQTWLTNQGSSLIADGAVRVVNGKVSVDQTKLMEHAQQYAQQIPDAAAFFGLTPERLAAKIIDKIPQVPAGAAMIAAAAPAPAPAVAVAG